MGLCTKEIMNGVRCEYALKVNTNDVVWIIYQNQWWMSFLKLTQLELSGVFYTTLHINIISLWTHLTVNLLSSIYQTRICLVAIITMLLQCYLNKLRLRQVETFESFWYQWRTNQAFTNTKERLLWIQESKISKQFTNFYQAFRCCVIISF